MLETPHTEVRKLEMQFLDAGNGRLVCRLSETLRVGSLTEFQIGSVRLRVLRTPVVGREVLRKGSCPLLLVESLMHLLGRRRHRAFPLPLFLLLPLLVSIDPVR